MIATPLLTALLQVPAIATVQDETEVTTGFPGLPMGHEPRVEIAWNRLYDVDGLYGHMDALVEAYPDQLTMEVLTYSTENRELRLYVLNDPETGPAETKAAMWIDGNVHGNEVQCGEAVVYTAWYLLENRATNERVAELLSRAAFYLVPTVNPDGRDHWFTDAGTASMFRSGHQPTDNDRDGVADEDGPNDLDGNGHITQMRKYVPGKGTHREDPDDPRVMVRVPGDPDGPRGDWILLGYEGIDDDGDGRINEDGAGGYDMNRAWPSGWQPEFVQRGAGHYPLYWPETRAVASFLYDHPNVAAVQSFHNMGGMILRGPGTESFGGYPAEDLRVFDALGADGERMLPFYRYWILWKDLYSVFGGFATWTYEDLGIISFTNEMWSRRRNFPDETRDDGGDRHFFDDHLLMGAGFTDWTPVEHPLYGSIEVGGFRKDVGRVPPTFLIEESLHRNALFCIRHAEAMPHVTIEEPVLTSLGEDLWAVDVVFRNERRIPTRTARARDAGLGLPDRFEIVPGQRSEVLAGGFRTDRFRPDRIDLAEERPESLPSEAGIPGMGEVRVRWFLKGKGQFGVRWRGEKALDARVRTQIPE